MYSTEYLIAVGMEYQVEKSIKSFSESYSNMSLPAILYKSKVIGAITDLHGIMENTRKTLVFEDSLKVVKLDEPTEAIKEVGSVVRKLYKVYPEFKKNPNLLYTFVGVVSLISATKDADSTSPKSRYANLVPTRTLRELYRRDKEGDSNTLELLVKAFLRSVSKIEQSFGDNQYAEIVRLLERKQKLKSIINLGEEEAATKEKALEFYTLLVMAEMGSSVGGILHPFSIYASTTAGHLNVETPSLKLAEYVLKTQKSYKRKVSTEDKILFYATFMFGKDFSTGKETVLKQSKFVQAVDDYFAKESEKMISQGKNGIVHDWGGTIGAIVAVLLYRSETITDKTDEIITKPPTFDAFLKSLPYQSDEEFQEMVVMLDAFYEDNPVDSIRILQAAKQAALESEKLAKTLPKHKGKKSNEKKAAVHFTSQYLYLGIAKAAFSILVPLFAKELEEDTTTLANN